jgi:hypothetical protein
MRSRFGVEPVEQYQQAFYSLRVSDALEVGEVTFQMMM